VFAVFDKDSDGFISMDEVSAVLASMGFRASPEYISDIFRQVDLDGTIMSLIQIQNNCNAYNALLVGRIGGARSCWWQSGNQRLKN